MHAAFDEAGGGNMIESLINAPLLDPTCGNIGVKLPGVTRLAAIGTILKVKEIDLNS